MSFLPLVVKQDYYTYLGMFARSVLRRFYSHTTTSEKGRCYQVKLPSYIYFDIETTGLCEYIYLIS